MLNIVEIERVWPFLPEKDVHLLFNSLLHNQEMFFNYVPIIIIKTIRNVNETLILF